MDFLRAASVWLIIKCGVIEPKVSVVVRSQVYLEDENIGQESLMLQKALYIFFSLRSED